MLQTSQPCLNTIKRRWFRRVCSNPEGVHHCCAAEADERGAAFRFKLETGIVEAQQNNPLSYSEPLWFNADHAAHPRPAFEHSPEFDEAVPYLPAAQVHHALEHGATEDETGAYHRPAGELAWHQLDPEGRAQQGEIDAVLEQMREV